MKSAVKSAAKAAASDTAQIVGTALEDLTKGFFSLIPWIEIAEGTIGVILSIVGLVMLWGALLGNEMGPADAADKVIGLAA